MKSHEDPLPTLGKVEASNSHADPDGVAAPLSRAARRTQSTRCRNEAEWKDYEDLSARANPTVFKGVIPPKRQHREHF